MGAHNNIIVIVKTIQHGTGVNTANPYTLTSLS
jgi:hypothetical protein